MKTFILIYACSSLLTAAQAQAPNPNIPDPPGTIRVDSRRDGFFVRDSAVYLVRNGATTKVEREVVFPNGLRVLPSGRVTLRDGQETTLLSGQWLDFEGSIDTLPRQAIVSSTSPAAKHDIGVSSHDGVTISGADVLITRNGATDKVTKDVHLARGVIVKADGTVKLANGNKITLRANQVLGLDGVLREAPVSSSPAGVAPSSNQPR